MSSYPLLTVQIFPKDLESGDVFQLPGGNRVVIQRYRKTNRGFTFIQIDKSWFKLSDLIPITVGRYGTSRDMVEQDPDWNNTPSEPEAAPEPEAPYGTIGGRVMRSNIEIGNFLIHDGIWKQVSGMRPLPDGDLRIQFEDGSSALCLPTKTFLPVRIFPPARKE